MSIAISMVVIEGFDSIFFSWLGGIKKIFREENFVVRRRQTFTETAMMQLGRISLVVLWLMTINVACGATIINTELVVDGSAENGLTGWTINTGSPVAALYASDTTPNPNPAVCGTHEFRADGTYTKMSQVISLTSAPAAELTDIDMSTVTVTYSCYVGGWLAQTDHAVVTFQPTTALGATTGAATAFTATPADRGGVTKMLFRTASMTLPATTRSFTVTYECFRDAGNYCDGYVDVVSIKLTVPSCSCGIVCPSGGSCPAGSYCAASTGYYQGVACSAGDYCASGSCTAANCPAGSYCSTPSVVAVCSSGSYCPARSTSNADCPAGSYCSTTTVKVACSSGSYCPARSTAEGDCSAGSYCSTPATSIACTSGSYCPARSTANTNCPAGSYCSTTSSIVSCSSGSYCPARSVAEADCAAGSYCATPATQVACTSGSYCPARSIIEGDCAAGSYCSTPSVTAVCSSGSYCPARSTSNSDCPAGTYCSTAVVKVTCSSGSYCPARSIAEADCAAGSYCSTPSISIACSSGSYCPLRSTSQVDCTAGNYCSTPSVIAPCSSGSYCPARSIIERDCAAGSYCVTPATQVACSSGSYCPARSIAETNCSAGSYCSTPSVTAVCSSGSYCPARSVAAVDCPAGFYCSTPAVKALCPAGSYCPTRTVTPVRCASYFYCGRPGMVAPSLSPTASRSGETSSSGSTSSSLSSSRSASGATASEAMSHSASLSRHGDTSTRSEEATLSCSNSRSRSFSSTVSSTRSPQVSSSTSNTVSGATYTRSPIATPSRSVSSSPSQASPSLAASLSRRRSMSGLLSISSSMIQTATVAEGSVSHSASATAPTRTLGPSVTASTVGSLTESGSLTAASRTLTPPPSQTPTPAVSGTEASITATTWTASNTVTALTASGAGTRTGSLSSCSGVVAPFVSPLTTVRRADLGGLNATTRSPVTAPPASAVLLLEVEVLVVLAELLLNATGAYDAVRHQALPRVAVATMGMPVVSSTSSVTDGIAAVTSADGYQLPLLLGGLAGWSVVRAVTAADGADLRVATVSVQSAGNHLFALLDTPQWPVDLSRPFTQQTIEIDLYLKCATVLRAAPWRVSLVVTPRAAPTAAEVRSVASTAAGVSVVSAGVSSPSIASRVSVILNLMQCGDLGTSDDVSGLISGFKVGGDGIVGRAQGAVVGNALIVVGAVGVSSVAAVCVAHFAKEPVWVSLLRVRLPSLAFPFLTATLPTSIGAAITLAALASVGPTADDPARVGTLGLVLLSAAFVAYGAFWCTSIYLSLTARRQLRSVHRPDVLAGEMPWLRRNLRWLFRANNRWAPRTDGYAVPLPAALNVDDVFGAAERGGGSVDDHAAAEHGKKDAATDLFADPSKIQGAASFLLKYRLAFDEVDATWFFALDGTVNVVCAITSFMPVRTRPQCIANISVALAFSAAELILCILLHPWTTRFNVLYMDGCFALSSLCVLCQLLFVLADEDDRRREGYSRIAGVCTTIVAVLTGVRSLVDLTSFARECLMLVKVVQRQRKERELEERSKSVLIVHDGGMESDAVSMATLDDLELMEAINGEGTAVDLTDPKRNCESLSCDDGPLNRNPLERLRSRSGTVVGFPDDSSSSLSFSSLSGSNSSITSAEEVREAPQAPKEIFRYLTVSPPLSIAPLSLIIGDTQGPPPLSRRSSNSIVMSTPRLLLDSSALDGRFWTQDGGAVVNSSFSSQSAASSLERFFPVGGNDRGASLTVPTAPEPEDSEDEPDWL